MKCRKTKLAAMYADGELGREERERFEAHLCTCGVCRRELEEARRTAGLFSLAPRFQAPSGFAARVTARLREEQRPASAWFPLWVRFGGLVALTVMMTAGVFFGRFLAGGFPAGESAGVASALHLEMFASAPAGSIGNAYLALAEESHEK